MTLYLDANVLVALLADEAASDTAAAFLEGSSAPLIVSELARGEVESAISRRVRMRTIDADDGKDRLRLLDRWLALSARVVPTEAAHIRVAAQLVAQFELALLMPDAIHIAAAQALAATLVTFDRRMAMAAKTLEVAVVVPV